MTAEELEEIVNNFFDKVTDEDLETIHDEIENGIDDYYDNEKENELWMGSENM